MMITLKCEKVNTKNQKLDNCDIVGGKAAAIAELIDKFIGQCHLKFVEFN